MQKTGRNVFQKRYTDGQQKPEKILNIIHHWGNAKQIHNITSHLSE